MSATSLEFFAMPDEQRSWLNSVLRDGDVWCVYRHSPSTVYQSLTDDLVATLDFRGNEWFDWSFFLGHRDCSESPVWRTSGAGKTEIDFIRSRSVDWRPSVLTPNGILLMGQLAIMRPIYYREAGIDHTDLQAWFRKLVKSFKALRAIGATVVQHTTLGTIKEWPKIAVTPGAVQWREAGHRLKQFAEGAVEFDIQTSDVAR